MPGSGAAGEFSPLWHVFLIVPACSGQRDHDAQITAVYAQHSSRERSPASRLPDGSPVASKIDAHFYFICSVVNSNAAP